MNNNYDLFEKDNIFFNFNSIRIRLFNPEKIRELSNGEVKTPETINYRTFRPEKEGLFCAKIFGPIKDYECLCGKYKKIKHKDIVCERCGVEVIKSNVRRERLGHINLVSPVSHIWFLKSVPSKISLLLDIPQRSLEKVIYCESYMIIDSGRTPLEIGELLDEEEYQQALDDYGEDSFLASVGAEAIRELLRQLASGNNESGEGLKELFIKLNDDLKNSVSDIKRTRIFKRIKTVELFLSSGNKPEWMILDAIPVLPPDLRPLISLDGNRFASSDLNDLYRRVINRNNRLRRLQSLGAPEIITRNEKRMLQESVDALFDNGRNGRTVTTSTSKRPLKSLSDNLKGKYGRFRQNLLGKRVDYSGRSVIIVDPELKLHQCGIPKTMALELFKPFLYNKLEKGGYVTTMKSAKRMVEQEREEIWDILEEIVKKHVVILNRAPTLHRLGMQSFYPILIEGKAIKLHPLVCAAFNADFDGDQMAVHIPLSVETQIEATSLMISTRNILSPASGLPIVVPSQDIVLGCYYATKIDPFKINKDFYFSSIYEALICCDLGYIDIHELINCKIENVICKTTSGRLKLYDSISEYVDFDDLNNVLNKKELINIIYKCYNKHGYKKTAIMLDKLKVFGCKNATESGLSISINDMIIPKNKHNIIGICNNDVDKINADYIQGYVTDFEKHDKIVDIWSTASEKIEIEMMKLISYIPINYKSNNLIMESFNPLYIMSDSGARGSKQQLKQLSGMRGVMAKPSGEIIETPVTANFREGLNVFQYFISTHGARKGLADTALKTANSGYLTRRLVDVAQDCIITNYDCGSTSGIEMFYNNGFKKDEIYGRVLLFDVFLNNSDNILLNSGSILDNKNFDLLNKYQISSIYIRSIITCDSEKGACILCYGIDMSTNKIIELGEAIGVLAAQSIGEPGTQLTMRTFHIGGVVSSKEKEAFYLSKYDGVLLFNKVKTINRRDGVVIVTSKNGSIITLNKRGEILDKVNIEYGSVLKINSGDLIFLNDILFEWNPYTTSIISEVNGTIVFQDLIEGVTMFISYNERTGKFRKILMKSFVKNLNPRIIIKSNEKSGEILEYILPIGSIIIVEDGDRVNIGDVIVKLEKETSKVKDITGGLPKIVDLFEIRKSINSAIICDVDGVIFFGKDIRNKKRVIVKSEISDNRDYLVSKSKKVLLNEGEKIKSGNIIVDGQVSLHDLLRVLGEKYLGKYLVKKIQEIYISQEVKINDKHLEVIIKQMLRKVKVKNSGDTDLIDNEYYDIGIIKNKNNVMRLKKYKKLVYEPAVLGITRSSLSTDSFISSASFQETTRVLTDAAISGKIDNLKGSKENIIVGGLVPIGTGADNYHYLFALLEI